MNAPLKLDQEKNRVELLAPEYVLGTAKVLTFGAKKYAAGNWSSGSFEASRLYGALNRHLLAWASGEKADPESGVSHLYHASCMLMFLAVQEERGLLTDDMVEIGARKGNTYNAAEDNGTKSTTDNATDACVAEHAPPSRGSYLPLHKAWRAEEAIEQTRRATPSRELD